MSRPPNAPSDRPAGRLRRLGRWAIVLWFAAALTVPPALMLAGVRPEAVENRAPAEAPGLSFSRLLDTDWFGEIGAWFTDRLPARDQAIEAEAWIDLRVFGDSPNPSVLVGSDDWLYLRAGTQGPCLDEAVIRNAVAEIDVAERALAAAGKRLLLVVAPNKDALYPEHLGRHRGDTACTTANRAAFRSLAAGAGLGAYLDTWGLLEEAKDAGGGLLYHRLDTHWTSLGAGVAAAAVVDWAQPGLWDPAQFVLTGSGMRRGDLSKLIGLPLDEEADYWVARPGVSTALATEALGGHEEAAASTGPEEGAVTAPALMLHDSTGVALVPLLRPYFSSLTSVRVQGEVGAVGTARDWFADRLADADLLVLVTVERSLFARLRTGLAANVVGALADDLPHREIRLESGMVSAGGGIRFAPAMGQIITTGGGEGTLALPDLGIASDGSDRFLVVEMTAKRDATVRLTWEDRAGEGAGSLQRSVAKGEATVVFRLPAGGAPSGVELHIASGKHHRVSRILVVEVPSRAAGS